MASINKLMKQAMKAQQQAQEMQAAMADRTVEATIGGGAVKVVACCDGSVKSIKLDPETLDPEDVEMLEDLVAAAFNDAKAKVEAHVADEMKKLTGGLQLPPGMELPF